MTGEAEAEGAYSEDVGKCRRWGRGVFVLEVSVMGYTIGVQA